ncbi:MAG: phosphodiester glycosidase family protein [Akkermansia sp.]
MKMVLSRRGVLLFLLCSFFWGVTSIGEAQHEVFSKKDGIFSVRDKINAYFFTTKSHGLVIRDEGDISQPKYGSLDAAMRKSPCVAGINGGFFGADAQGSPLGLVVQDGKRIHPLETGSFAVVGVIYDTGRELVMCRSKGYLSMRNRPSMIAAIQGGPFLVERGKAVRGLNDVRSSYRTFIATNGKGEWCLAVSSAMTLSELAKWLAVPGALGKFKVMSALNLDGGSSSAFWCHESGVYYPSMKSVRNYVGVAPRGGE